MGKLDGKTAIVTGAASGMGRAAAMLLAQEGADIVLADRHESVGVQEAIAGDGGSAISVLMDVAEAADWERTVATALRTSGRLDVLFNNAGIVGDLVPTDECTLDNWMAVLSVNLTGVFLGMKYSIPAMLKSGGGSIINNASVDGLVGIPNAPAYCASKGGVVQLTKAAALEYARRGIRVNAICPGVVWTPLSRNAAGSDEVMRDLIDRKEPMGRGGEPEEIARLVLFLASDDSSFCTGAPFVIDGGLVAA
jgi:NAD(P)-dependent dehydrogenase (short-subunit alcohol dehydrogenase family)